MIFSILIFPLLSFLWCSVIARPQSRVMNATVASMCMAASAFFAGVMLQNIVLGRVEPVYFGGVWIALDDTACRWSFASTPFVGVMNVVITTVSTLVHVYSIAYMQKDPRQSLFMGYLSFFTLMMLVLVSSDNLLQLFFGWEGVGLASYLLIGFWFEKPRAAQAAQKAFLMNRIGDFGLVIAIALIYMTFGTLSLFELTHVFSSELLEKEISLAGIHFPLGWILVVSLGLAASGKSAQIFLHTWLPDAMEGPTPVSSLLHSATMVTAGVFLLLRFDFILTAIPFSLVLLPVIGAITTLYAGVVALTATDIKKIIAYSTCSQLGLMIMIVGLGSPHAGFFHLVTHAYVKSLLFLVAGAIIYGLSGEQDIRNMGGMWRYMPINLVLMVVGALALIGVDPLSGAYSKKMMFQAVTTFDALHATSYGDVFVCTSVLTAMYTTRMVMAVFFGKTNTSDNVIDRIASPQIVMISPMIILAVISCVLGIWLADDMMGDTMKLFANPGLGARINPPSHQYYWAKALPLIAMGVVVVSMSVGKTFLRLIYIIFKPFHDWTVADFHFNKIYQHVFVEGYQRLGRFCSVRVDDLLTNTYIWDRTFILFSCVGNYVRSIQNGDVMRYILILLITLFCSVFYALCMGKGT